MSMSMNWVPLELPNKLLVFFTHFDKIAVCMNNTY